MILHRPHGIEHPYAASADQRVPVQPLAGDPVQLGVTAAAEITAVICEWSCISATGTKSTLLPLARAVVGSDAAALAGGEGHLAEAQAASLGSDQGWSVTTEPLVAEARYRYRFTAVTEDAAQLSTPWFDVSPARWTADAVGSLRGDTERVIDGSLEWLVAGDRVLRARFALPLLADEHIVGFGERFDVVDQRGRTLDAVVFEQYKSQGRHGRTYLPMPFAHVVRADGSGWGFHVRTSRRSWYDVGAAAADRLMIEVALGASGSPAVDLGVYEGGPSAVLTAFLDEVGRAEELPGWVFRLWASGNEWNTQALVMERMNSHRDEEIPVGAVVIEAWSDEEGITIFRDAQYDVREDGSALSAADFTYPPGGAWPDPKAMIAELHARGIKVLLWQIPLQKTDVEMTGQVRKDAEAMVREGHAVLEADGSAYHNRGWWFPGALMPDLSAAGTRAWWSEKRRYLVRDLDVDGFKTDGGEHAWGHDLQYADGRRGDEGNNRNPVHYARTFGDLLRSEGKAPVTFSRAGFTGSQAHGVFWAGDEDSTWEAFRCSITAGLTAAACGIVYWGWDLAGFSGPVPDAELYLRAAGASAFMPIMQYHSEFNHHQKPLRDRTPWHVAQTTGDATVIRLFRRFARLRGRLVPYLEEQAARAVATDAPLMRPLFFDFGDDPQIWSHPAQWLLGDDLLVNPVTCPGATMWETYLPAGDWVDVWNGERFAGRQSVSRDVPMDIVPVFARASAWQTRGQLFS